MRFGRKLNVIKPRKSRVNEFGAARFHPSIILAATREKRLEFSRVSQDFSQNYVNWRIHTVKQKP
jgi:hypothetical protein